ncbi:hypothetical protein ABL840_04790 [Variovorax sp. NFACC27]|uniref:Uncharacterized protein n=1 Tax=Variovorax paradoxus TaxID=34073 RepID=A0A5Q0LZ43_VARPD|nr:hypothetical protein [Variovorax paradoxus]SEF19366.1 hypothetical protein SAMN03159371_00095 [Variovorax sp. NFACC28]SEF73332.1 hypothetical protein SAMN03159365_00722 [Variovorax sp. NFACC29]SFB77718.1 hypothetical protein SAMN03159379_00721 [Variovorax sp. NFACC26]SFG77210.1 hypothetical protein SAMN03159447_04844 [Variovorax sp. NFACC27]QFZ81867.1 hypothetical protein GFK26_03315 [Variovorax paradoxus]
MRRLLNGAAASVTSNQNEIFVLDEAFLQRVDRVMLQRKQTDPFQREAAWRATEEEVRVKRLRLQHEDPVRSERR